MDERNNHFDFDFTPIGQAIKKAREARGITREQLSGIIGYAPRHIQSIENEGQYKAKTAKGTSLPFILLIITGYIAGISAKFISGQINYVLIAYILNLAIVSLNVIVYFRNVSLDKKRLQNSEV